MKQIKTTAEWLACDSAALANSRLDCPLCDRPHIVPIQHIRNGRGAIVEVPEYAGRILGHRPEHAVVIYDKAIEPFILDHMVAPIVSAGLDLDTLPVGAPNRLLECEISLAQDTFNRLNPAADILIAAGSGVICDLTKWLADRLAKPFMICGSALSMNAYSSITGVLTIHDVKTSLLFEPAALVLLDADVVARAPLAMILAGLGDLAARSICNADWMLSHLLRQTYFCPLPFQTTAPHENYYYANAAAISRAEPEATHHFCEANLISGISMTMLEKGEPAPSSGAEHVLSHFWDLLVHLRGLPRNLHGTQVGIGTIISLTLYEYMRNFDPGRLDPQALLRNRPSIEELDLDNRQRYPGQASEMKEIMFKKRIPDGQYAEYVRSIQRNWESIWESLFPYTAPVESIRRPLQDAGFTFKLDAIQRTPAEGLEALLIANHNRQRYTILDLAWELGIFPAAGEEILTGAGVL